MRRDHKGLREHKVHRVLRGALGHKVRKVLSDLKVLKAQLAHRDHKVV